MKRFWKKINRGLVLGAILLLLLIAVVAIKEIQFKSETDVIAERAREATLSLLELNLSSKGTQLSAPRSEASVKDARAKMEAHLEKYWDVSAEPIYYYWGADDVRTGYEKMLSENTVAIFHELTAEIPDSVIQVRSNGPDYALVSMELNRVSAVFEGFGEGLFCGEYYVDSMARLGESGLWNGNYRGYAELEMHRVGGEWRVCGISMYLNLSGKTAVELPTGGEE